MMAAIVDVRTEATVTTAEGNVITYPPTETRFAQGTAGAGKREPVTLTGSSTFNALSPPSGTKGMRLFLPSTAASLTLKGVTGDGTGIVIVGASGYTGLPIILPLSSASVGILNAGSTITAEVEWY
jgi:hypothetical protein